jgi:hypothetical protein
LPPATETGQDDADELNGEREQDPPVAVPEPPFWTIAVDPAGTTTGDDLLLTYAVHDVTPPAAIEDGLQLIEVDAGWLAAKEGFH